MDLVERLRKAYSERRGIGYWDTLNDGADEIVRLRAEVERLKNREIELIGEKNAMLLEITGVRAPLAAENERLRAALGAIANHEVSLRYDIATTVQKIAEAALAADGKGNGQ